MREVSSPEPASWAYGSGGQLRAVWRLAAFCCVLVFSYEIVTAAGTPVLVFVSAALGGVLEPYDWLAATSVLIAVSIALRQIDGQPWSAVGLGRASWRGVHWRNGALLGSATIGATALLLLAAGDLRFAPDSTSTFFSGDALAHSATGAWLLSTLRISLVLAPAALFEELIFRGYVWRVAEDSSNSRVALCFTSVLFGLVHVQNPGANVLAIANVMLAGICLGLVRQQTGSLIAAWAAHFAWNWGMAAALHVSVSGLPMATPAYRAVVSGPVWFSGGTWGPEGGAAAAIVLTVAIACGVQPARFANAVSHFTHRPAPAAADRS